MSSAFEVCEAACDQRMTYSGMRVIILSSVQGSVGSACEVCAAACDQRAHTRVGRFRALKGSGRHSSAAVELFLPHQVFTTQTLT